MGLSNSNILAKEDANRFLAGLIVMLLVFALLLPLTVIMYIDVLAVRSAVKEEVRQLKKLKKELETQKEN
jgi:cell division protein FtsB